MLFQNIFESIKHNYLLLLFTLFIIIEEFLYIYSYEIIDFLFIFQHLLVFFIALIRKKPLIIDKSIITNLVVLFSLLYPVVGFILVKNYGKPIEISNFSVVLIYSSIAICTSALISLNTSFSIRPSFRELKCSGAYRVVRHPIYLSYIMLDFGYLLYFKLNFFIFLFIFGWISLLYRIEIEESILKKYCNDSEYFKTTKYKLFPFIY